METTLHQQLKQCYAQDESQTEVTMGRFRIDVVRDDELIEIQCASLSAIRDKCRKLLERHPLRVVKPVVMRTRIAKVKRSGGEITSRRMSPKRGDILDVFDELIYFTRVFPHDNLIIEIPLVHVEQIRSPSRKRRRRAWHKNYHVEDTRLESIESTIELREPQDLLTLIDVPDATEHFTTADLASWVDRPRWKAQQIAYVLRKTGAVNATDRKKTGIVYQPAA
ncbi:MAG: hypothetical protein AAGG48_19860 [Planctomycetota bacterium]